MKAVRVHAPGGPEVLRYEEVPLPAPRAGEALVRLEAIGVNYIDVQQRAGRYSRPLPFIPGLEGAGTVETVGADVRDLRAGDRVAYASGPASYAEYACVPAQRLVPLPAGITAAQGAALMLQGMTAHYLVHSTCTLKSGEWALVHAAAGGVGLLLTQMATRLGARVIATVSTEEKAALARQAGAEAVILYATQDFEAETKRLTSGRGVSVVYDSVGKDTFEKGLAVLAPRGLMVLYGQASGPVAPIDPQLLAATGSVFLTRPTLGNYTATRDELRWRANDLFRWIQSGELAVRIEHRYPLAHAAESHRALEGRRTTGKVLLLPARGEEM
jgi:NADPH2:quinone reductase